MASIDNLPPDQRAVLELVLGAGRSYDEIARILSIDRAGVRERALAALDALGPQTRVPAGRRALITDYLLGALPDRVAGEVRAHLGESASERAWTRVVASELQGIAKDPLPEIPTEGRAPAAASEEPVVEAPPAPEPPRREPRRSRREPRRRDREPRPSSRLGGAILLGIGVIAAVAVVLAFVVLPGGGNKHPRRTSATGATGRSSAQTQVLAQINLRPPSGGAKPIGLADVLKVQGRIGVAIVAQGLAANSKHPPNAYAVWLYNSPSDSQILGFVNPGVGSNGQLRTAGALPNNARHYQKLLVTLETQSKPRTPGTIVLEGNLTGV